jgi:hypothetical protein
MVHIFTTMSMLLTIHFLQNFIPLNLPLVIALEIF